MHWGNSLEDISLNVVSLQKVNNFFLKLNCLGKKVVSQLVKNLQRAFEENIKEAFWLDPPTRDKALEKINLFRAKIGYPDVWLSFNGLYIEPKDFFDNVNSANLFFNDKEMNSIGEKVDKEKWFLFPSTVDAYYESSGNEYLRSFKL